MTREDFATAVGRCEELLCQGEATHVLHDDLGAQTDVCDAHAAEFPEDMLEPIRRAA